jgi:hypothetical protein
MGSMATDTDACPVKVDDLLDEEWLKETRGKHQVMYESQFKASMFEYVDLWTEGVLKEE